MFVILIRLNIFRNYNITSVLTAVSEKSTFKSLVIQTHQPPREKCATKNELS